MRYLSFVAKRLARTAAVLAMTLLTLSHMDDRAVGQSVPLSFGSNANGRTGQGTANGSTPVATPIDTTNLLGKTITQAAAGYAHSLLLVDDGTVFSFGWNGEGRTGQGTISGNTLVATPIDTTNLAGRAITQAAAGGFSLLLADDGAVFSFGWNGDGRTGQGTNSGNTLVATPIDTTNLAGSAITQVAAGDSHGLLLSDDGTVFSFGGNDATGQGTNLGSTLVATPIDTTNLAGRTITQVAAGDDTSLLLTDDGTVFAFGVNETGQAGLGTSLGSLIATPIDTSNLAGKTITQVAAGRFHSLLLAEDGTVFSFGHNEYAGQGTDSGDTRVATPIDTTNLSGKLITQIAAGYRLSLLLADDGTVFSFGYNGSYSTGLGTDSGFTLVATPIDRTNLTGLQVTGISAGWTHGLLLAIPVPEPAAATLVLLAGLPLLFAGAGRRRRTLLGRNLLVRRNTMVHCGKATLIVAAGVAASLLCVAPTQATKPGPPGGGGPAYDIISFEPFASTTSSDIYDLNEWGTAAVGSAELPGGETRFAHFDIATQTYNSFPAGVALTGINNLNQMVGAVGNWNMGAYWDDPSAVPVTLPPLNGDVVSRADGINDDGVILGYSGPTSVVWRVTKDAQNSLVVDGPVKLPPLYTGAVETWGHDINEIAEGTAQIVGNSGNHAVVWTIALDSAGALIAPAAPVAVGTLGAAWSEGLGINNFGDVSGRSASASVSFGAPFVALAGQDAQPLPVPRRTIFGVAYDINDQGEVAGSVRTAEKGGAFQYEYAYLWQDGNAIDLNKQIPGNSGWNLRVAELISDGGIISGWGNFDVHFRGFLLIPNAPSGRPITSVPEPSAVGLAVIGLLGLAAIGRRRLQQGEQ